jgi:hypothetical protein
MTDCFRGWLQRPDLVESSPDSPAPLDLLYGSKTNFLANVIHEAVRKWPSRDPERLAGGWLCYHFIKWLICPTQEAYSRLQPWQRLVEAQLRTRHPYFVDLLWWPVLRTNVIDMQHRYDVADVFALLTYYIKVPVAVGQELPRARRGRPVPHLARLLRHLHEDRRMGPDGRAHDAVSGHCGRVGY